jgi:nucleotide-binding universal stress UspA family protein
MLRSALVALDGSACSESAGALAIDRAGRFEAWLLGLGVLDAPSIQKVEPVPLGAGADETLAQVLRSRRRPSWSFLVKLRRARGGRRVRGPARGFCQHVYLCMGQLHGLVPRIFTVP